MIARLSPGAFAAWGIFLLFALCLALETLAPWLSLWPEEWSLPLAAWTGAFLDPIIAFLKPGARALSDGLELIMDGANWLLTGLSPFVVLGAFTALGWWIWGWRGALLTAAGLGYVLASGYWVEGMNTLALVFVSFPLAVLLGFTFGLLAFEVRPLRGVVTGTLDVMQTVPTFAYLVPLLALFSFGPVVGLIASAIYAAPPMARSVLLGLDRVEPEIREAAIMSGGTRRQQLFLVEIPAARDQIMVGVNQCLMAALSMVIIAAVIGGFEDIGWEVVQSVQRAKVGPGVIAGLVIVVFAIIIDRLSAQLAKSRARFDWRIAAGIFAAGCALWLIPGPWQFDVGTGLLGETETRLDAAMSDFNRENGAALGAFKQTVEYFGLLPMRIGLDQSVLPFTWGFAWTTAYSLWMFAGAAAVAGACFALGRPILGAALGLAVLTLETGVTNLPWPVVVGGAAALGYVAGGWRLAAFAGGLLAVILVSGLWERALLSIYLCGFSVLVCLILGGLIGLLSAVSRPAWTVARLYCDTIQTIPLFVILVPLVMLFQISEFTAFLAIIAYAIAPMIRYTHFGLTQTPPELLEAATASGATPGQTLWQVRVPYAAPSILLGLNQTILYAFAMLIIASLVGTQGLGMVINAARGENDLGLGIAAGLAMAFLALVADRLLQGFAEERRKALGL